VSIQSQFRSYGPSLDLIIGKIIFYLRCFEYIIISKGSLVFLFKLKNYVNPDYKL
jgi:hypothetical protein